MKDKLTEAIALLDSIMEEQPSRPLADIINKLEEMKEEQLKSNPIIKPSYDGIYPRCVWCGGENYAMAVIEYSKGLIPCASTGNCGKKLPKEYIKLKEEQINE